MKARMYLVVLGILPLISGCQAKRWRADQFEGIWHLENNKDYYVATGIQTPKNLTLRHDGKFVAISIPATVLGQIDTMPDRVLSGEGTWSMTRYSSERDERLQLSFTRVEGFPVPSLPYGAQLFIQGSDKKPSLFYFIGDPDDNERVVFRRE